MSGQGQPCLVRQRAACEGVSEARQLLDSPKIRTRVVLVSCGLKCLGHDFLSDSDVPTFAAFLGGTWGRTDSPPPFISLSVSLVHVHSGTQSVIDVTRSVGSGSAWYLEHFPVITESLQSSPSIHPRTL